MSGACLQSRALVKLALQLPPGGASPLCACSSFPTWKMTQGALPFPCPGRGNADHHRLYAGLKVAFSPKAPPRSPTSRLPGQAGLPLTLPTFPSTLLPPPPPTAFLSAPLSPTYPQNGSRGCSHLCPPQICSKRDRNKGPYADANSEQWRKTRGGGERHGDRAAAGEF